MGAMSAFGLGVLLGAACSWSAARRYERFHRASVIAALHVGEARTAAGGVARGVAAFALLLVVGALFVWAGR
jgi:hypothetical protein